MPASTCIRIRHFAEQPLTAISASRIDELSYGQIRLEKSFEFELLSGLRIPFGLFHRHESLVQLT